MVYRKLGKTGVDISEISLGTERLEKEDRETVIDVIKTVVDNGVNYIDLVLIAPEPKDNIYDKAFDMQGRDTSVWPSG